MAEGFERWPEHMRVAVTVYGVAVMKADPPRRTYRVPRTRVGPKPGRTARRAHRKLCIARAKAGLPRESFKSYLRGLALPATVLSRDWVKRPA